MITPVFEITQEENFIILRLRVPHLKVSSFDFYIEEDTFKFSGKPYFLRLIFPSPLIEDGSETASYNIDTGILTLNLPKKVLIFLNYFLDYFNLISIYLEN